MTSLEDVQKVKTLDELWALIPSVNCKQKCQECCGPIGLSRKEEERIQRRYRRRLPNVLRGELPESKDWTCPELTSLGTCGVYADRPTICRLWGTVEPMVCEWGCRPEDGLLDPDVARAILEKSMAIGGPV